MVEYILTPGGKGILRRREAMIVKRRLCIAIPSGAVAYVNGKECKCDGTEAWIPASSLQHINTIRITHGRQTWCCEGFSYVDGVIQALGFDVHEVIATVLEEMQRVACKVDDISTYVEAQKRTQEAPLFF